MKEVKDLTIRNFYKWKARCMAILVREVRDVVEQGVLGHLALHGPRLQSHGEVYPLEQVPISSSNNILDMKCKWKLRADQKDNNNKYCIILFISDLEETLILPSF
jgi:hypothetical protein